MMQWTLETTEQYQGSEDLDLYPDLFNFSQVRKRLKGEGGL